MSSIRNKMLIAAVFSILLLSGLSISKSQAFAAASDDNSIKVAIDGNYLTFDVPPAVISGRTMVPLRVIFEGLGASVTWDSKTKTVIGQKQGKTVKLIINNKNAYINGKVHKIDVPPMVINGRTLVPTRFIAESLGTDVYWEAKAKTVTIIPLKAIKFPDAKLEAALRTALKKPTGSIMTTDAKKLKKLNLENKGISNIDGLQYFRGLTELNLNKNNIKDITSLGSLTELTKLEFKNNKVRDVSILKNLTKLIWLLVSENQIADISPIKELSGMSALDISYNQINDISCLSNLKKLEYFYLLDNPLRDISVLKGYKNLKKIYVVNPKTPDKLNQQLFDRFEKMDKKVKEVVASVIKPEMTELEKEMALHDYVVTYVKYDKVNFINDTLPSDTHEAYGALINGTAVCDGYAEALQLLLNAVGIECIKVRGETDFLTGSLSATRKDGTKWGMHGIW
ncbi:stalk domain-containing protein [Pseudobacteroides cellulosolvens]|uniref:Copper amine oxidase-like domain-containing protein n=1 Tax=Pseudobacteroides cellulosolvens ATCC 35603 = DSM 2933 TaxID=398512 RepID=A0A0L6JJG9_9FIRM|nr:stalk domain-containing protein [Pseudobacteroides cellulosolvens]KNY26026.1 copper amine oxidase-like domain-containing protein [Pseudobacteroides cellulosolvens ATCC 35603 = DSM 2933]